MKNNTLLEFGTLTKTKNTHFFLFLSLMLSSFFVLGQNAIVGTGFSTGWGGSCPTPGNGNFSYLTTGWAGGTLHLQTTATGTGNRFFRFGVDWSGQTRQLAINPGNDVEVVPSTSYTLNSNCASSGAQFINVTNTSHNYVFKTLNGGTNPTGTFVFFEVQGDVRTVTSVTRDIANVGSAQSPVITANLSGALSTGQAVYLRYTTNNYANSTVVQMTGNGSTYTANIPTLAGGANVSYYVFTSGPSNVATDGSNADLYTINWNAGSVNGGSNFTYTVETQYRSNATTGNWNAIGTWQIHNGTTWVAATATPTNSNAGLVSILNGHTVTVTAIVTVDQVVIEAGGQINCNAIMTLANGQGDELAIFGSFVQTSQVSRSATNYVPDISIKNGGLYIHNRNFTWGILEVATGVYAGIWEDGSTCRITVDSGGFNNSLNRNFFNLEFNWTSGTTARVMEGFAPSQVRGTFKVENTGTTGSLLLGNGSTSRSLAVNNFEITGGNFYVAGQSASNTHTLTVNGNFSQLGGNFEISRTDSAGTYNATINGAATFSGGNARIMNNSGTGGQVATLTIVGNTTIDGGTLDLHLNTSGSNVGRLFLRGDLTLSSGELVYTRGATGPVTTGSAGVYFDRNGGAQTFTWSGGTLSTASGGVGRRFYFRNSSGPADLNEVYSANTAQETVNGSQGTSLPSGYVSWPTSGSLIKNLIINNPAGVTLSTAKVINTALFRISGALSGTPALTYASGATLHYNGTDAITTADKEFPSSNGPTNLIVGNPAGVTLHTTRTLSGNLTVNNSGVLDLAVNTLNRATSGGAVTLESGTTLKIGGTNSFPANYATHTLNETSLVEYKGTVQQVAALSGSYGIVTLSNEGEKTFASGAVITNLNIEENGTARLNNGRNITVKEKLDNGGLFTIENNANLLQEGTTNTNAGAITVLRNSSPLWRLDYTLWSSPVDSQNLLAFSPLTVANRFYVYNPSTNLYNNITPSTNSFQTGVGYLIRMPDNHVSNTNSNPAQIWEGEFLGLPNNGDVTISVTNNTFNAVGNPYPSTLSASAFYTANNLTQPLYFWRKVNGAGGSAYATWTTAGGASSGSDATIPNGIIQVGQGFILRSTSTSVVFNNAMRAGNNANQFLRMTELDHNRVRLVMAGPNNFTQNILVNYMSGATNEVDLAIDGKYINDSETAFYSLLDEEAYVIQGRALPFDTQDIVPLGFKTTQTGNYTINLMEVDGLFEQEQQGIYLRDLTLNLIHDFQDGAYAFASEAGVFNDRFELLYQNEVMNVPQNGTTTPGILYTQGNEINLNVGNFALESVRIFDLAGRLIHEQSLENVSEISMSLTVVAKQALLVQYQIKDLGTFTKKIIF